MSLSEREIARKLAERDELEPPAGLLEKIKSEIPPMIPAGTGVPEIDRRPSMPPRQRWLIAASVVTMIGAGLLVLHRTEVPAVEETARTAAGARKEEKPAVPPPPPSLRPSPTVPQPEARAFAGRQLEPKPAPKPLSRKDEEKLKALGYVSSGVEGRVEGGTAGGTVAGVPGSAPAPAPAAPPAEALPEVQAPAAVKKEADAEAPLRDERREKVDRINVGGNEPGRQNEYAGPGATAQEAAKPQAAARAKAAVAGPLWQVPSSQPITLETDADMFSYAVVRRSIAAGTLPDPAVVRVGQIVNAFEAGDAPPAEGASTPFVHGPQYRLLRLHPGGTSPARVSFNPSVVVRYRLIGTGVSTLYEIELRPGVSPQDALVAVLHLGNQGKAVVLSALDSPWPKASPGFRLAALAAEFAEILKSPSMDSSALHRLSAEIGELPKGPKAAELAEMVEKAGRIRE